jgi:hypothetical protein
MSTKHAHTKKRLHMAHLNWQLFLAFSVKKKYIYIYIYFDLTHLRILSFGIL